MYPKKTQNDNSNLSIITRYNKQQHQVKRIIEKYWHMLTLDPTLGQFVPTKPLFTFKRASSISDKIVSSEFKNESMKTH